MKFVIDIPEREFKGEIADHFQDFFMRLQAEIQHRLSSNDTLVCGNYELETVEMLLKSFKNATIEQEPKTDLDNMRAEMLNYLNSFVLAGRNDLASAVSYCITIIDKCREQELKTGHWDKGYTFPDGEYWKCTKCNELIKVKYPMNYCNNCGSRNKE